MALAAKVDATQDLAKWKGAWAQPWDYTTSHGTLRVKLARRGKEVCVILLLKDCSRVSFADSWDGFNATIETHQHNNGVRHRVKDSNNLDVDCGAIDLSDELGSYAAIPAHASDVR
jgi:hypothetical protein